MRKYWTETEEAQLKIDYSNEAITPLQFEEKYNRNWSSIKLKAHKLGLCRHIPVAPNINIPQLLEDYHNPEISYEEIKRKHNIGHGTLYRALHDNGIHCYKQYTDEELAGISADFKTLSKKAILAKWGRSWIALRSTLKRLGLFERPKHLIVYKESKLPYSVEEIVRMYRDEKLSTNEIAEKCNIASSAWICQILERAKCPRRSLHEAFLKYHTNEHYFDTIDTHNKAYLLGLFAADGYNREESGAVRIGLQEPDRSAMEFFLKELESDVPLITVLHNHKKNQVGFVVHSPQLSRALASHGVIQRKSLVIKFPTTIPDEFISSLFLGWIDGDGCVYFAKDNHSHRLDIVSTKECLVAMQEKLRQLVGIEPYGLRPCYTHINEGKNTWCLSLNRKPDLIKLFYWLYGKTDYWFDRKYQKFAKIVAQAEVRKMYREYKHSQIIERKRFKTADDYEI